MSRVAMGDATGASLKFNFLQHIGHRSDSTVSPIDLNRLLAFSFVTLLVIGFGVLAWQWKLESREITAELQRQKTAAEDVAHIRDAVLKSLQLRQHMQGIQKLPVAGDVLSDLSMRLPSNVWLTYFSMKEGRVELTGVSPAYTNIVALLQPSPLMSKVALKSSMSLGLGTSQDRFDLNFEVKGLGQ